MAFLVDNFRQQGLYDDGARPNLFEVSMFFPAVAGASLRDAGQFTFLCKAAQVPGSNMGVIEVPYFGRQVKVAGNRTYDDWTVTVMSDESYNIRSAFERWHNAINDPVLNSRNRNARNSSGYTADLFVKHYAKSTGVGSTGEAKPFRIYQIKAAFPSNIAPIDLDWGSNDTIEEFTVTFAYQYWLTDENSKASLGSARGTTSSTPEIKVAEPVAQGPTAENPGIDGLG